MAEGQGAAVGVEHALVDAQQVGAGEHLPGEGLVELDRRELPCGHPLLRQQPGRRGCRPQAQPRGVHPLGRRAAEGQGRRRAQVPCDLRRRDQDRRRPIRIGARIPCGHGASVDECRREAGQQLGVQARTRAVVGGDFASGSGHRHELLIEPSDGGRLERPAMAAQRERVLALTVDPVLPGHGLGRGPHVRIPQVLGAEAGAPVELDLPVRAATASQRSRADALGAAGQEGASRSGLRQSAGQHDGVEPRAALPIDRDPRDRQRQAGLQGRQPCQVASGSHRVAHHDVRDGLRRQARLRHEPLQDRRQQTVHRHVGQRGPCSCQRGPAPEQEQRR